jgi:hypothetical protein
MKTPRILIIDLNLSYCNPTTKVLNLLFRYFFEATFFGPGFVDTETLKKGLDYFIEANGPFDFVFASEHIVFCKLVNGVTMAKSYNKYYVKNFDIQGIFCLSKIYESFLKLNIIKCVTMLRSDFYNFTEEQMQVMEGINAHIVGFGNQFNLRRSELLFLKKESFALRANDNWFNFINKNDHRIISIPAFVSHSEFSWSPISCRKVPWSVMGIDYWARKEAKKNLARANIYCRKGSWVWFFSLLDKLNLSPFANPLLSRIYNYLFQVALESSRYSFTCGSGLGYPIRKFFEIPALGSVLVCIPCNGFKDLGFVDKKNAISCMPQDILDVHNFLESDQERAQDIANAGRELVWKKHTAHARARQIARSLAAIKNKKFMGTYWNKGTFYIREKDGESAERQVKVEERDNYQGDIYV